MRISLLFAILTISVGLSCACRSVEQPSGKNSSVEHAFEQHESNVQVEGEGTVTRILADDNVGSPHQKFIVRLPTGQTVLIEHNIELAPRIDGLKTGDTVSFSGEYVWNDKGGLIHWTHHDPAGRHQTGWIKYAGRTYQ